MTVHCYGYHTDLYSFFKRKTDENSKEADENGSSQPSSSRDTRPMPSNVSKVLYVTSAYVSDLISDSRPSVSTAEGFTCEFIVGCFSFKAA